MIFDDSNKLSAIRAASKEKLDKTIAELNLTIDEFKSIVMPTYIAAIDHIRAGNNADFEFEINYEKLFAGKSVDEVRRIMNGLVYLHGTIERLLLIGTFTDQYKVIVEQDLKEFNETFEKAQSARNN